MELGITIEDAILAPHQKAMQGIYNLHRYNDECKVWPPKWAGHLDDFIF